MNSVFFLIMRRMRKPLLVLISIYSMVIIGLLMIPGMDDQGQVWRMDIFHALYFVSFMATTIGFGEIPYAFTDGQRLWILMSIYATVIAWIYSVGTLIALFQDPVFRRAKEAMVFTAYIKHMKEDFYLLCGYGETGSQLVASLTGRGLQVVVIEKNEQRANLLQLETHESYVPVLCGDAATPANLLDAGLNHKNCKGVVALTKNNHINLKIAITSKLLHNPLRVVCRADSHDVEANMASFGTDYIVDPFDTFSWQLSMVFESPSLYMLQQWLTGSPHSPLLENYTQAPLGHWIICGYGRFGKAVYKRLKKEGLNPIVIEAFPDDTKAPVNCIKGRGTEAVTLNLADISIARGIVAATNDDANNLSIIMSAREINPDLFVVIRQNLKENDALITAIHADMVMNPSQIIANKVRVLLITPLLADFLSLIMVETDEWARILISRIMGIVDQELPESWEVTIDSSQAYAICQFLLEGKPIKLAHLLCDSRVMQRRLPCIVLMIKQQGGSIILPDENMPLKLGDRILFTSCSGVSYRIYQTMQNTKILDYVVTGRMESSGWLWQKLSHLKNKF